MKKQLGIAFLCSISILTACAPGNKETIEQTATQTEATSESSAETQVPETQAPETTESRPSDVGEQLITTYQEMAGLLGAKDDDIKDSFGGGAENKSADGSILIGREYKTMFQEEDVSLFVMYDDNKNVNVVQVILPGKDSQKYKDEISKELGIEAENAESSENGGSSTIWNYDGVMYTLFGGAEESILEIIIPEN